VDLSDPGQLAQRLLARQLDEQMSGCFEEGRRLRVLDAGLGRGVQALRLARAGHEVTGLQSDPDLRELFEKDLAEEPEEIRARIRLVPGGSEDTGAHFLPGAFDVVLCHGGLTRARDPGTVLAGLARVLGRGGLLSLLIRNDAALAMHPGRTGDWDAALAALDFCVRTGAGGGASGGALRLETLTRGLAGIGTPLRQWYGVGIFGGDDLPADEEQAERMLAAEERAGREEPYRSVGAMLHVCGVRA
jgi:SAM-dependent methyltransferase